MGRIARLFGHDTCQNGKGILVECGNDFAMRRLDRICKSLWTYATTLKPLKPIKAYQPIFYSYCPYLRTWTFLQFTFLALAVLIGPATSVNVDFENCLSPNVINSKLLQFQPQYIWTEFDSSNRSHQLNITVYGNVVGAATNETLPEPTDPRWQQANFTLGKIVDEDQKNNHRSTFFARFNVLDYTPYDASPTALCEHTIPGHQQCPLIPVDAFSKTNTINHTVNM